MKSMLRHCCCLLLAALCSAPAAAADLDTAGLAAWLDAYGKAWETRDADLAITLFSPDATYQDMPFSPPHQGHAGIHAYWAGVTADQRNVEFDYSVIAVSGNTGIAHWSAAFDVASSGAHLKLDGVFVLEFAADGKCRRLREWWHLQAPDAPAAQ